MLRQIFNQDNLLFRFCDKLFDLVLLSLIWVALCLPVVTIGPATAALYYAVVKCIRRGEDHPYRNFFQCFRLNLKTALIVSVLLLLFGVLVGVCYQILSIMGSDGTRMFLVLKIGYGILLFLAFGVVCYLFPLLSRFSVGAGRLLLSGLMLALRHLPSTLVTAMLVIKVIQLSSQYLFLIFFAPSVTALVSSLFLERIFKKYSPQEAGNDAALPWYLR